MAWIAYSMQMLSASQEALRCASACQYQADANRHLCVECDQQARHRALIAQRLIEQCRVRIEFLRPFYRPEPDLGLLLCSRQTRGVRLLAIPEE